MSLTSALNISVTGLNTSQAALAVVSQNVSNANNEDYSRKIAQQETALAGAIPAGVRIGEIRRIVDEFLAREVRATSSDLGRFDIQQSFLDRLQSFFGDPGSDTTLTGRLDRVFASFETATTLPQSTAARTEVVRALEGFAAEANELFNQTQLLRKDADQQVVAEINAVNGALLRIEELNRQISREINLGGNPTELQDLRDAQVDIINESLPVTVFEQSSGAIALFAGSGTPLLDGPARTLVYAPAATVTPQTVFDRIQVFAVDSNGNPVGIGTFLESDITTGRIRGLLDLRDDALPDLTSELGELVSRVADEINRAHNDGTAFPPPNTLTGARNTGLIGTDLHNFTGSATFTVVDPNAPTAGAHGIAATVTIDFGAIGPTVTDVINAVNAGLGGAGTLSLTGGVMSFSATNPAHGVGIVQDATTPSTRAGRGFAHFFGLNDLLTARLPTFFDQGFTAGETHSFTGITTFRVLDADRQVVNTVSFDAGAAGVTFANLITSLNTALSPSATFALNATTGRVELTPAAGFTILAADEATANRGGTGMGLATLLGFGPDKVQRVPDGFAVNTAIANDPTLLGLGKLQGSVVGDVAITVGDNRGALGLAAVATTQVNVNAAGNLPAQALTLGTYAGSVIAEAASYASQVDGLAGDLSALFNALDGQARSISGVNVDEEMSNLIVLQNAFAASARVVSTVDEMFQELLAVI